MMSFKIEFHILKACMEKLYVLCAASAINFNFKHINQYIIYYIARGR